MLNRCLLRLVISNPLQPRREFGEFLYDFRTFGSPAVLLKVVCYKNPIHRFD